MAPKPQAKTEYYGTVSSQMSLVRGGLLYRLDRFLGLISDESLGIGKRVLVFCCMTWVPLVILGLIRIVISGQGSITGAIFLDLEVIIRLLLSGPILIAAEAPIERRVARALPRFKERGIIQDLGRFDQKVLEAGRRISGTPSVIAELVFLILIILSAISGIGAGASERFRTWRGDGLQIGISVEAAWFFWISLPWLQFLLLRWVWRFIIWARLLWGISRLRLKLFTTHPDAAGGLGFVAAVQGDFAFLWSAVSAYAASTVAVEVLSLGRPLEAFYIPIFALLGVETLSLLAPMVPLVPHMIMARRLGTENYGSLSSRYVGRFESKWYKMDSREEEHLLGSSDFQSLADLGNGFDRVIKMRTFPAGKITIIRILAVESLPFFPLLLLVVPARQILEAVVRLII